MNFKEKFWGEKLLTTSRRWNILFFVFTRHIMNLAQAVASCLAGKHPSKLNQPGSCDQALTPGVDPGFYMSDLHQLN